MKLSDFFQSVQQKNHILTRDEYLSNMSMLNKFSEGQQEQQENELDQFVDEFLQHQSTLVDKNLFCWSKWMPGTDFGFTGSHLNETEQTHFQAIETLIRSDIVKNKPGNWLLFRELRAIGQATSGVVLEVGPPEFPNMFAVKSPKEQQFSPQQQIIKLNTNSLLHEYLVGKQVANFLRAHYIPNFLYYFGIIKCDNVSTFPDNSKNVVSWCDPSIDNSVPQIIMENSRNSKTLLEFFHSVSNETLLFNLLTQVINAIFWAFKTKSFSHNDLHPENVLVRPIQINKPWFVPVAYETTKQFQLLDYVAMIIDLGQSSFVSKSQTFVAVPSSLKATKYGVSRPLNDCFHLFALLTLKLKMNENTFATFLHIFDKLFQWMIVKKGIDSKKFASFDDFTRNGNKNGKRWWKLPKSSLLLEHNLYLNEFFQVYTSLVQLIIGPNIGHVGQSFPPRLEEVENVLLDWLSMDAPKIEPNDLNLKQKMRLVLAIDDAIPMSEKNNQVLAHLAKLFLDTEKDVSMLSIRDEESLDLFKQMNWRFSNRFGNYLHMRKFLHPLSPTGTPQKTVSTFFATRSPKSPSSTQVKDSQMTVPQTPTPFKKPSSKRKRLF